MLRNGEVVEFFPQSSNGQDLGLADDEIVLTESEEAELAESLRDFTAKMKVINQKMDDSQKEIDRLSDKSAERQKRFEIAMQKLDGLLENDG
ncbi:MAG: hypothetical protein ACR2L1_04905 [Pyrinomonadaceae bacterium]